jgi:hypothetical protein
MIRSVPPRPAGIHAQIGTAVHRLAEIEASRYFELSDEATCDKHYQEWLDEQGEPDEEMLDAVKGYIAYLEQIIAEVGPGATLTLEQVVETGIPNCWGTADAIVVGTSHLHVVDLKYGAGVRVQAEENPQLKLYGVGALDLYEAVADIEEVCVSVYQPRLDHVETMCLSASDLRAWRDSLLPIAKAALGDEAEFGPSEEACRWCPAAGHCRAQIEHETALDFDSNPETIDPDELALLLPRLAEIRQWCNAVEAAALRLAHDEGVTIPGYKVVQSITRRRWRSNEAVIEALREAGYDPTEFAEVKPLAMGKMEKLLGKDAYKTILTPHIVKPPGKPALVPEDDRRNEYTPNIGASEDFSDS